MLSDNWQLAVSRNWAVSGREISPFVVPYSFKSQIIRIEITVPNVPSTWRRAGYLQQTISLLPVIEISSKVIPINRQKIIAFPLLTNNYHLVFIPVRWIPVGLKLQVWEYRGVVDSELLNQFLFIN